MTTLKTITGTLLLRIMLTATASVLTAGVLAQQFQASLSHYSTDDGLASNAISDITRDDYGYIWIATWNGLSRFDGFNFYNYATGNRSGVPLLHNRIIDLKTDLSQNIWLRMYDGRIFVLNRSTDKIENPLQGISGYQDFRTGHQLTVTGSGDVLAIINDVGIYKMRLDKNGMNTQLITTGQLKARAIAEGYKGDIWVGTNDGIHRLNQNDDMLDRKGVFTGEAIRCMYSNGFNIYAGTRSGRILSFAYGQEPRIIKELGQPVQSIFVDSRNQLWFTTDRQGVSRMNLETDDVKDFTQTVLVPEYDVNGADITEVNQTVWMSMNHGGFGYYNRQTDEVEYFHNDPDNPWNLSNTVASYLALPEGVILESTSRKGLEKLDILKKTIRRIQLFPNTETTNENEIRAMFYDTQTRQLFVGNKHSSLFVFKDKDTRSVITDDGHGNRLGRIYGINKDRSGNYWISSKGTGLIRMTPSGGGYDMTFFRHDDRNPMSLSSDNVYCSVEDNNGNIWVATYDGGVNILTRRKNGRYVFLNSKNVMKHYPYNSYHKVRTLAVDKQGNVWAGTTDGLLVMSYENNRISIQKVSETAGGGHDLNSRDIVCLACDGDGTMWIGTNGGGLSCTAGKDDDGNWRFETFDSSSGLPSEEIKSITFDRKGNVWFATDHILCSLDTEKRIISTFSILDGVDDTICSEGAAITLPDGNVMFGTLNGYYFVDRKKLINSSGSMLKLRITDFYLDNELVSPRLNDALPYYVPDSKTVQLPDQNSTFAFRFASLNYQLQHRVHYQYMLEGYDTDWQNAGKERMAVYSGVPAGKYIYKVKAFLLESPDKYDMRTIEVIVPPHFLMSADAIWFYMGIAVVIMLAAIYMRQRTIARREMKRRDGHGTARENGTPGHAGENGNDTDTARNGRKPEDGDEPTDEINMSGTPPDGNK